MGKVQQSFGNGSPGAVSRSVDDIIISVRNAGSGEIPFGAPVFLAAGGAVPFDVQEPQEFTTFLGFAVRVADKTPDAYPAGQFSGQPVGAWQPGDLMEVLVRGGIAVPFVTGGSRGGSVYIRKSDGKVTPAAGTEGSTVLLENVRIRNTKDAAGGCGEVIVNRRNII